MFKKLFLVLFLISISNLYSHEIDSVEVLAKPKYIGFSLGAGLPELVYGGVNLRLTKGLYFNYKIGGAPKGRTLRNINLLEFDNIRHTFEMSKYFDVGEVHLILKVGQQTLLFLFFLQKVAIVMIQRKK